MDPGQGEGCEVDSNADITLALHPVECSLWHLHWSIQLGPYEFFGHGRLQDGPNSPAAHSQNPKSRLQYPLAHCCRHLRSQFVPKNPRMKHQKWKLFLTSMLSLTGNVKRESTTYLLWYRNFKLRAIRA